MGARAQSIVGGPKAAWRSVPFQNTFRLGWRGSLQAARVVYTLSSPKSVVFIWKVFEGAGGVK